MNVLAWLGIVGSGSHSSTSGVLKEAYSFSVDVRTGICYNWLSLGKSYSSYHFYHICTSPQQDHECNSSTYVDLETHLIWTGGQMEAQLPHNAGNEHSDIGTSVDLTPL